MKRAAMIPLTALALSCLPDAFVLAAPPADPSARFAVVDRDGDGVLSFEEFAEVRQQRLERIRQRLGDRLTPEMEARRPSAEEAFARLDADADGFLTREELARGRPQRPRRFGDRRGPGAPFPPLVAEDGAPQE